MSNSDTSVIQASVRLSATASAPPANAVPPAMPLADYRGALFDAPVMGPVTPPADLTGTVLVNHPGIIGTSADPYYQFAQAMADGEVTHDFVAAARKLEALRGPDGKVVLPNYSYNVTGIDGQRYHFDFDHVADSVPNIITTLVGQMDAGRGQ